MTYRDLAGREYSRSDGEVPTMASLQRQLDELLVQVTALRERMERLAATLEAQR